MLVDVPFSAEGLLALQALAVALQFQVDFLLNLYFAWLVILIHCKQYVALLLYCRKLGLDVKLVTKVIAYNCDCFAGSWVLVHVSIPNYSSSYNRGRRHYWWTLVVQQLFSGWQSSGDAVPEAALHLWGCDYFGGIQDNVVSYVKP